MSALKVITIVSTNAISFLFTLPSYNKKSIPNKKPVIAFVAGNAVPFGHKMGYAGDILTKGNISVLDKKDILAAAGITVVNNVNDIHTELAKLK